MIITVKSKDYSQDELSILLKKSGIEPIMDKIGFDWKLNGENTSETLEDFQLFCISIVKDLFKENSELFEDKELDEDEFYDEDLDEDEFYDDDDDDDEFYAKFDPEKFTSEALNCLFNIIAQKKIDNEFKER